MKKKSIHWIAKPKRQHSTSFQPSNDAPNLIGFHDSTVLTENDFFSYSALATKVTDFYHFYFEKATKPKMKFSANRKKGVPNILIQIYCILQIHSSPHFYLAYQPWLEALTKIVIVEFNWHLVYILCVISNAIVAISMRMYKKRDCKRSINRKKNHLRSSKLVSW